MRFGKCKRIGDTFVRLSKRNKLPVEFCACLTFFYAKLSSLPVIFDSSGVSCFLFTDLIT